MGKRSKVKTVATKKGKSADKTPAGGPVKFAEKASTDEVAPIASNPKEQGLAGAKVVGFTNLGNTCFFNSVLQVFTRRLEQSLFGAIPQVYAFKSMLSDNLQYQNLLHSAAGIGCQSSLAALLFSARCQNATMASGRCHARSV